MIKHEDINFLVELHEAQLYSDYDAIRRAIRNIGLAPTRHHMQELVAVWTKAQLALWDTEPKEAA